MSRTLKHILLFVPALVVVVLIAVSLVRRTTPRDTAPPPDPQEMTAADVQSSTALVAGQWTAVGTWNGTGVGSTARVRVKGSQWRIVWSAELTGPAGLRALKIEVFDEHRKSISEIATTAIPDHGVTTLDGPGIFTIAVNTPQEWNLKVEEMP